jgi:hypothetical protein
VTAREIDPGSADKSLEGPLSALGRWRHLIWQSSLKGHVKIVALAVALCCEPDEESCSPSVRELVGLVNMGFPTVADALTQLETDGYVEVDRDPEYVTNEYTLVFPIEDR